MIYGLLWAHIKSLSSIILDLLIEAGDLSLQMLTHRLCLCHLLLFSIYRSIYLSLWLLCWCSTFGDVLALIGRDVDLYVLVVFSQTILPFRLFWLSLFWFNLLHDDDFCLFLNFTVDALVFLDLDNLLWLGLGLLHGTSGLLKSSLIKVIPTYLLRWYILAHFSWWLDKYLRRFKLCSFAHWYS